MLKRLNDALPELVLGLILYGVVIELAGVWFVTDKLRYSTGLLIGIVTGEVKKRIPAALVKKIES